MLTGYQAETIAFQTEYGEFVCANDAHARLESEGWEGVEGFVPVSRYELEEYDAEASHDYYTYEDDHADECYCTQGLDCDECGLALTEAYTCPACAALQNGEEDT